MAGWGVKPTSRTASQQAARRGVPYLALEDGFLRSLDLGVKGAPPLSLVVDDQGIYYDATRSSALETMLNEGGWETGQLRDRAAAGIRFLRDHRLSKYNAAPERDFSHLAEAGKPVILIVDQTRGDASVTSGLASAESFDRMVAAARAENPDAFLVVKTHPDVAAGLKRGYLGRHLGGGDLHVVAEAVNPWSLLAVADRVYTVTSQLGFEALMAGKPVRCFGMPFYAGWGATEDDVTCPRRKVRRSVEDIFAAAYLCYARYVDPFTGHLRRFEDIAELLADWKRRNDADRAPTFCVGMSPWKRRTVDKFLASTESRPRFCRSAREAVARASASHGRVVVWASREPADLAGLAAAAGVSLLRLEDGFLRSVGLGADFLPAASLALDAGGMYYDPRSGSDLEALLEAGGFDEGMLERAGRLRAAVVREGLTKYNVGRGRSDIDWPAGQRRILVPGQVEDDRSVRLGSPVVTTNLDLLARARAAEPNAFIVYKPHPDVEAGHRRGAIPDQLALDHADRIVRDISSATLIGEVDEVHTMTSLIGFEALLRGKAVTTHGAPFYAGWGLTRDMLTLPHRIRRLTLDELVAGTLIAYPRYVDPVTGLPCPPELVVARLAQGRGQRARPPLMVRLRRLLGGCRVAFGKLART
ncbi:capsule polysaccharide transporter [Skermanella stibiiresistens SB22]|uniref:Capsule polysaccharide transporter n=1 Tax=Skermanella stibiiresistens SB22 TaxID=1385369 RepID=W9GYB3_9PROT|nr:capsule polysaccharide transporter [Skermanella stibiiresistens SB22]